MALKRSFFRTHHILSMYLTSFANRVIAREDEQFNIELLKRAAAIGYKNIEPVPIKDTFIGKHFENLLSKEKYQFVTENGALTDHILDMVSNIKLNFLIIEELEWMHQNYDYTYHHTIASTAIAMRMALDYFLNEDIAMEVGECALVKDIGLGHIPNDVVNKSGRLTKKEQLIIQEHPMYSALLLSHYYGDYMLLPVECALNHHEDMLGSGYPRGIILDRIEVQIVKFADTFDALITARPFRNFFTLDDAFLISEAEIKLGSLDASLLPLVRSYHNFQMIFNKDVINSPDNDSSEILIT